MHYLLDGHDTEESDFSSTHTAPYDTQWPAAQDGSSWECYFARNVSRGYSVASTGTVTAVFTWCHEAGQTDASDPAPARLYVLESAEARASGRYTVYTRDEQHGYTSTGHDANLTVSNSLAQVVGTDTDYNGAVEQVAIGSRLQQIDNSGHHTTVTLSACSLNASAAYPIDDWSWGLVNASIQYTAGIAGVSMSLQVKRHGAEQPWSNRARIAAGGKDSDEHQADVVLTASCWGTPCPGMTIVPPDGLADHLSLEGTTTDSHGQIKGRYTSTTHVGNASLGIKDDGSYGDGWHPFAAPGATIEQAWNDRPVYAADAAGYDDDHYYGGSSSGGSYYGGSGGSTRLPSALSYSSHLVSQSLSFTPQFQDGETPGVPIWVGIPHHHLAFELSSLTVDEFHWHSSSYGSYGSVEPHFYSAQALANMQNSVNPNGTPNEEERAYYRRLNGLVTFGEATEQDGTYTSSETFHDDVAPATGPYTHDVFMDGMDFAAVDSDATH